MSSRSAFDLELQTAEKKAAEAQEVISNLRKPSITKHLMGPRINSQRTSLQSMHLGFQRQASNNNNININNAKTSAAAAKSTSETVTAAAAKSTSETVMASPAGKRALIMQNKMKLRYRKKSHLALPDDIKCAHSTDDMQTGTDDEMAMVRLTRSEDVTAHAQKKLDKYGFILNMDSNGHVYPDSVQEDEKIPSFAETKTTERKERRWNGMMQTWTYTSRRRKLLSKHLRQGIPDSLRSAVWPLLGNVPRKIAASKLSYDEHVRKSLESAGDMNVTMPRMRSESLVNSNSFQVTQETIERDIHRTYPRHSMFHEDIISEDEEDDILLDALNDDEVGSILAELDSPQKNNGMETSRQRNFHDATGGQAALRRVLRAYSVHDRDVGYCQGMNFIAGMFLTFMSEEESFWLLVYVMNDPPCRMRGLFGEGMKETHVVLYIAEKLTYQFLPKLAKHMEAQSIHITMYATQWLLTLYTSSFQFDLVTRVWDCFLAEGYKIVYRVMLALLQKSQATLLDLSFEDILAHFRELPKHTVGDEVIDIALKIPLRRKHLARYEKEYHAHQGSASA